MRTDCKSPKRDYGVGVEVGQTDGAEDRAKAGGVIAAG
jgi:hypothetical protein